MKKDVKVYTGRAGTSKIKHYGEADGTLDGTSRVKSDKFILNSLEFGIRSFFSPGVTWWCIVVIYCCLELSVEEMSALLPKNTLLLVAVSMFLTILFDVLRLPLIYIAIKLLKNEKSIPSDIPESLSYFWNYFIACLIEFAVIILPMKIFIFIMKDIPTYTGLFIVGTISAVWMVYWSCRLFPYFFIVIDRKLGAVEALSYSTKITYGNIFPVFLLSVVLAIIGVFLKMIPYHIGTVFLTPFVILTTVYAYKFLDSN